MYSTTPTTILIATICCLRLTLLVIATTVVLTLIPLYLDEKFVADKKENIWKKWSVLIQDDYNLMRIILLKILT